MQEAPCRHGWEAHSATSLLHTAPAQPLAQAQAKEAMPSVQLPPLAHGWLWHSSVLVPQVAPVKPATQLHATLLTPSVQVPPCRHDAPVQSITSATRPTHTRHKTKSDEAK